MTTQPEPPDPSTVADFYAALGLTLTEAEISLAQTALRLTAAASKKLDDLVALDAEPLPAFLPPTVGLPEPPP